MFSWNRSGWRSAGSYLRSGILPKFTSRKINFRKAADRLSHSDRRQRGSPSSGCVFTEDPLGVQSRGWNLRFRKEDEEEEDCRVSGGRRGVEKPDWKRLGEAAANPLNDGTHLRGGAMAICLFYFSGPDPASITRPILLLLLLFLWT